jgi:hypothetical protein
MLGIFEGKNAKPNVENRPRILDTKILAPRHIAL